MTDGTPDRRALSGTHASSDPRDDELVLGEPIPETQTAVATAEAEIGPLVAIIVGSSADIKRVKPAEQVLRDAGVPTEINVMSAHLDPQQVATYCKGARGRGLRVIIAASGLAASLPSLAASHTDLPVIGLPLTTSMTVAGGLDALLSIVQTPPGLPIATVGIDNPVNAAQLALRILSI